MLELSWQDVHRRAEEAVEFIRRNIPHPQGGLIYPIPNGGIPAALAVLNCLSSHWELTEDPAQARIILDDLVDSGATKEKFEREYGVPVIVLLDKKKEEITDWVSFPWERMQKQDGPQDNVRRILQYIGENQNREGLKETPDRVVRSYDHIYGGYKQNVEDVLKVFEDGACDEMVILKNIEMYSNCEHHMQPFFGKAHVAYIPKGKVIGVSKLARIVDIFSRRLQIQERLTQEITKALDDHLQPMGSACVIEARHLCMCARGVQKQHSTMVTSSLTGVFREGPVRQEFLSMLKG